MLPQQAIDFKGLNTNGYLRWAVNPTSFRFPATPLLLASQYGLLNSGIIPQASSPIRLELNDVVQIVLQNRAELGGSCSQVGWEMDHSRIIMLLLLLLLSFLIAIAAGAANCI